MLLLLALVRIVVEVDYFRLDYTTGHRSFSVLLISRNRNMDTVRPYEERMVQTIAHLSYFRLFNLTLFELTLLLSAVVRLKTNSSGKEVKWYESFANKFHSSLSRNAPVIALTVLIM